VYRYIPAGSKQCLVWGWESVLRLLLKGCESGADAQRLRKERGLDGVDINHSGSEENRSKRGKISVSLSKHHWKVGGVRGWERDQVIEESRKKATEREREAVQRNVSGGKMSFWKETYLVYLQENSMKKETNTKQRTEKKK